jgi:uncharacterized membrane protein YdjX (TVP38/TMEM64 family)
MQQWLSRQGGWAWLAYVAAGIGLVSIGFPRIVLSALGGAMFGVALGTLWSQVAMTLAIIPPCL